MIVNADDFGISPVVNHDIVACFAAGRISSATIIANLPGSIEACALAHDHGFADRLGVHLNLSFGPPLSEGVRPFCSPEGSLAISPRRLFAPPSLLTAVYHELRAQVKRIVRAGIIPTHLDSHQHIINGYPYTRVTLAVAREFGIHRMRITRNALYKRSLAKAFYKGAYNCYLRRAGMRTVRSFTEVKAYYRYIRAGGQSLPSPVELMAHPGGRCDPALYGTHSETSLILSDVFAEVMRDVELISYSSV